VPLKGDNRELVLLGMRALSAQTNGPLAEFIALIKDNNQALTSTDIAFRVAPRINAAGRIGDPNIALKALLQGGPNLKKLDRLNTERQRMTSDQVTDALNQINESDDFIVVESDQFHPGIVGLIAGKLCEQFGKPALVAHRDGAKCVASLRSIDGYDVTAALRRNKKLLTTFGGHAQAAGCGFLIENFTALKQALLQDVAEHSDPSSFIPTLNIDIAATNEKLTLTTLEQLQKLEPFGMGNPEPLWLIKQGSITNIRAVGTDLKHLQLTVNGTKAIAFNLGHLAEQLSTVHDVVFKLNKNIWQGQTSLQFVVEDIR
jgi:single-stranded-DNA-specific exonuclease